MFKNEIRNTIRKRVQVKKMQNQRIKPKWMNREAREAVKRKQKAFSKYLYARKNREYQK